MSITKELEIKNIKGVHARAAAAFVKLAETFSSKIEVERIGMVVSGLSIMGLMMLSASKGTTIKVTASGSDEKKAMQEITKLIDSKFGEE
ncbi:MAG: HPr family phosphocarrier protein [Alphaproteobacteria bacterium]|nr:HPr family phosphocarrier protein [Alphaproteobacteria bacterium]